MALNEKTRFSGPVLVILGMVASIVSGTIGVAASVYAWRDNLLDRVDTEVSRSAIQLRLEREQALRHYVPTEDFLRWREQDKLERTAKHYELLNEIRRLGDRVNRR